MGRKRSKATARLEGGRGSPSVAEKGGKSQKKVLKGSSSEEGQSIG